MENLPREVTSVSKGEIEPFKHGRRVGCYFLGKTLGEGSFAKVKEGLHIITGEKVAVKIIDKKRAREDRYISKNLRREARIHQLVRHPNIIQLYEVLETDNYYYLVMEYCAGGELLDYICTRKRLEEHDAKRIIAQLVSAVDGMHKSGVVHRDLKIENFLLNENEDLKIIDFGLSNTLSTESMQEYERTGVFPQLLNTHCGSPAYAAPELLAQKKYGPQVDVWSIGINMYAMLTGFLPYMMEPFNVIEMYEKMMQRRMTPIPGFLSKPCRDLLMRLLEPVAEWRITLKQVMKHKWFTGSEHVPRSIPLGDMMYQKRELCESILSYMKFNLKIRTKDTINAVVSNRAVHASAVYHLLVTRLDRYLKQKKEQYHHKNKQFEVEVIKKSNLSTDEFSNQSTPTNARTKKFTFRGKKIDGSVHSQHDLSDKEPDNCIDGEDKIQNGWVSNENTTGKSKNDHRNLKNEFASNSAQSVSQKHFHPPNSPNTLEIPSPSLPKRTPQKGHRRALSTVDANDLRQAEEINKKLRNSMRSDSSDTLTAVNHKNNGQEPGEQNTEHNEEPTSATDPFCKDIVSRKQSYDVGENDLGSPSCQDRNIDIVKYLSNSPRMSNDEKRKVQRKISMDYQINEINAEHKEPIPGWMITKIIKQPPLKEETGSIHEMSEQKSMIENHNTTDQSPSEETRANVQESEERKPANDVNNNDYSKQMAVSEKLRNFTQNNARRRNSKIEESKLVGEEEICEERVNELVKNVRNITENYLKHDIFENKVNDEDTPPARPPEPKIISQNHRINNSKIGDKYTAKVSDDNNNKSSPKTQPIIKSTSKATRTNSIRGRILALENYEQKQRNKITENNITSIKKITISKKTLELNVKEFSKYKFENKNDTANHVRQNESAVDSSDHKMMTPEESTTAQNSGSPLKPLELKFKFKIRKKKEYKEQKQTKSMTDILDDAQVDTKPSEEQMLTPKHRCADINDGNNDDADADKVGKKEDLQRKIEEGKECLEALKEIDETDGDKIESSHEMREIENAKRATIKITSHPAITTATSRTTIFLSSKKRDVISEDATLHNENTSKKNTPENVEQHLEAHIDDSKTKVAENNREQPSLNCDDSEQLRDSSTKEKTQPMEVHSVKYRCIPVYQPEYTKTGTIHSSPVHRKEALEIITEENKNNKSPRKPSQEILKEKKIIHRKWASQTIEPTQEPVGPLPRSAEIIQNIKEKLRKEQEMRMAYNRPSCEKRMDATRTRSRSTNNSPGINTYRKVDNQHVKQCSLEVNKHRICPQIPKKATYGFINTHRGSVTKENKFDIQSEKGRILAFAQALEHAAWRKRNVISAST